MVLIKSSDIDKYVDSSLTFVPSEITTKRVGETIYFKLHCSDCELSVGGDLISENITFRIPSKTFKRCLDASGLREKLEKNRNDRVCLVFKRINDKKAILYTVPQFAFNSIYVVEKLDRQTLLI